MKAHVGVDSKTKMIHSVVATAANVADCIVLPELLHGEETKVWGDQAYRGQTKAIQEVAPEAQDMTHNQYRFKNRIDEVERGQEPQQVASTLQNRTRVCRAEATVRVCEGALPWAEEKRQPAVCYLRSGEPVPDAQETVVPGGVVSLTSAPVPQRPG